jgi:hypothetical protein
MKTAIHIFQIFEDRPIPSSTNPQWLLAKYVYVPQTTGMLGGKIDSMIDQSQTTIGN